jgi:hypothetical protein
MNSRQEVLRVAKSRSALRGDFCSFSLGLSKRRRNWVPVCSKKFGVGVVSRGIVAGKWTEWTEWTEVDGGDGVLPRSGLTVQPRAWPALALG